MMYGVLALLATWFGAAVYALATAVFVMLSLQTGDKRRWGRRASLSIGAVLVFLLPSVLLGELDEDTKAMLDERAFTGVLALGVAFAVGVLAIGRGSPRSAGGRETAVRR